MHYPKLLVMLHSTNDLSHKILYFKQRKFIFLPPLYLRVERITFEQTHPYIISVLTFVTSHKLYQRMMLPHRLHYIYLLLKRFLSHN